jgi:hypothetical protein
MSAPGYGDDFHEVSSLGVHQQPPIETPYLLAAVSPETSVAESLSQVYISEAL